MIVQDIKHEPLILRSEAAPNAAASPISLRIYTNTMDRRAIYGLRYRAYRDAKLIDASETAEFSDDYDNFETTKTVAAFYNETCVGSLRLAFATGGSRRVTMPCQGIFSDLELIASPASGALVEFTRMVVDPSITNNSLRSTLYGALVRGGMIVCNAGDADHALIAVLPKMMRFYQFMCGFDYLAGPRPYPGVNEETNLMGRAFRGLDARRDGRNRFFKISSLEIAQVRTLFAPAGLTDAAA